MTNTTPNMDLVLPDVIMTTGPGYAYLINAAQYLIDSHDHSPGKGVKITPAGMNISSDLTISQNNITNLRTARLYNNSSITFGVSDLGILYELNNELYYRDGAGNVVQITLNGAIDLSSGIEALLIKDTNFFLENASDTTKQARFNLSNLTTGTTYVYSFPAQSGSDTLVTDTATQTLTNKTITDPIIAQINTGTTNFTLPTTDGSNGYVLETNGSGVWSFQPPSTATPASIVANTTNVTYTSASNNYVIDTPTSAITYTMPASLTAGIVWTFVNNSANLITVQTSGSNVIDYVVPRGKLTLIPLTATPTTAANWLVIAASSAWNSYTPTYTGFGTTQPITESIQYRRNGSEMQLRGTFQANATTQAVIPYFTLPLSFTLNTSVISTTSERQALGNWSRLNGGTLPIFNNAQSGMLVYDGTNAGQLELVFQSGNTTSQYTADVCNSFFTNGDRCNILNTQITIAGWGG